MKGKGGTKKVECFKCGERVESRKVDALIAKADLKAYEIAEEWLGLAEAREDAECCERCWWIALGDMI